MTSSSATIEADTVAATLHDGVRLEVGFVPIDGARLFVACWSPTRAPRAQVVFVSAFGDEAPQMRRSMRLAAEAMARSGVRAWIHDFYGTGDSEGEHADATVERWERGVDAMVAHVRGDGGAGPGTVPGAGAEAAADPPVLLLGCRLGSALALRAADRVAAAGVLCWAPVLEGRMQLSALTRVAAVAASAAGRSAPDHKAAWARGETRTLAGYDIGSAMAAGLQTLSVDTAPACPVVLLDVRPAEEPVDALLHADPAVPATPSASPAVQRAAERLQAAGGRVSVSVVPGAPFWNVADHVDVPALPQATLAALEELLK